MGDRDAEVHGFARRERTGAQQVAQRLPLEPLADDVGRACLFALVEHAHDVWVCAHAAHRLRLAGDTFAADVVEAIGLDQGEGDVAVEQAVVREVDLLLPALAEEAPHLVAPAHEGCGLVCAGCCWGRL